MKRIILCTAFAMGVFLASAQTGAGNTTTSSPTSYTSRVSTDNEIRQVATQLQLNEGQYIKFRDLSRARNEQLREANNMYANDAKAYKARVQAINKDFESQLAQSVSQKQFADYLAFQGRVPSGSNNQASGYGGTSTDGGAAVGTSVNGGAVNNKTSDKKVNNAADPNKPAIMNNEGMSEGNTNSDRRKNKTKNKKNKNNTY